MEQVHGGVEFTGAIELMYHANLRLSTAHRVLLRIASFLAQSGPALFGHMRRVAWEHYLGFQPAYSLHVTSRASKLNHYDKMRSTISSAISAEMAALGLSPALAAEAPVQFHVRLEDDRATLSVHTSGEHLHRRGYRTHVGQAPLRETLAAALLLKAGVQQERPIDVLVDPMCGSGTLLLEAARIRRGQPAGAQRSFAFEQLPFYNESQWQRLRAEAVAAADASGDAATYLGSDRDEAVIAAALANAAKLGLSDSITFAQRDAFDAVPAAAAGATHGLLVANLPYGHRLQDGGHGDFLLADLLEHFAAAGFRGSALIICSRDQLPDARPGVAYTGTMPTYNGALPVQLASAELNSPVPPPEPG
jgi:putative N6-adenine-specific DNA methylase